MLKRKALITGVTGQDGSYLAELLLSKDYEVYGLIRRHSNFESELGKASHLEKDIKFEYGDLNDMSSLEGAISRIQPHEVYNLAAQSQVRISFDIPQYTTLANALGPLNLMEAIRKHNPYTRFYQASTSEMFGNQINADNTQDENTPMIPVSPYGSAKLCAHHLVRNYRESYGMFACSGILFNHESPRRGSNFITMKIVKGAIEIYNGRRDKLELGNLNASRDWGHASDYVRAMWMMMQHSHPDDYVVATGKAHSVRYLCEYVFGKLRLDMDKHVTINPQFFRPNELEYLCGNPTKIKTVLGWEPKYTFETLLDDMIETEMVNQW